MPTDEMKQLIASMREASEALKGVQRAGDLTHADPRFVDFIMKCAPANVLDLIAEIERLERDIERLQISKRGMG